MYFNVKITFLPQTHLGKWSLRLTFVFLFSFGLLVFFAILDQTFHENSWLLIPVFTLYSAVILSFLFGLISVLAKKEKSLLIWLALAIDLLFLGFEVIDILFSF